MILTLDPLLSSSRKVPNWENLSAISIRILTTVPSVNVNFISSGNVGLVPIVTVLVETANAMLTKPFFKTCLLKALISTMRHAIIY